MTETAVAKMEGSDKRLCLVTLLLFGGALNAYADNDVYDNVARHPRSNDVLQTDTSSCSQQRGAPQSGHTDLEGLQALHARSRLALSAHRERARTDGMYPDPDSPGLMCRDFKIGGVTGSSCSNF